MVNKLLPALALAATIALVPTQAKAEITARPIPYTINGEEFEGYMTQNTGFGDNQPLVVLIHDWDGINAYEKMRTNQLSTQGYTVMAIDLYGKGVRPQNVEEARMESSKLYNDRELMRSRMLAGLEVAQSQAMVDPDKVVVMGYCFGGGAALELARSGIDLDGFVSFHGSLGLPEGQSYDATQGQVLILHGSNDPVAPMDQVAALATDLTEAEVPFSLELYGGALHSFTRWGSDDYHPEADLQSWDELSVFLRDVF